ncbi:hypothetical protein [Parasphingorhabdus sp. NYA22]
MANKMKLSAPTLGRNGHKKRQLLGAKKSSCHVGNWARSGHRNGLLRMSATEAIADWPLLQQKK